MAKIIQKNTVAVKTRLLSERPIITIPASARRTSGSQAMCRLLVLLGAFSTLTGCGQSQRKVVATWRGEFIGQKQANEKVMLSPPALDVVSGGAEPGSLQIDAKQTELMTFDLEKRYETVGVVRNLTPEQAEQLKGDTVKTANIGVFLGGMWLVPPAGASLTAGAAVIEKKKAAKRDQAEREVIEQLKNGQSTLVIPIDYRWSTLKTEYKREIVGEQSEPAGVGSEQRVIPAVNVPLKIENSLYPDHWLIAHTDDSGRVSFDLATTLAKAAALKPGRWKVSAKWAGKWHELGVMNVTPEWIAQVVHDLRERKMRAVGIPELPPAASMSLRVSKGRLEAGAEGKIALYVVNTGMGEFYRLAAITESTVPALDGLRFEFGKVAPGEGLELVARIRIPREQPAGRIIIRFRWSELNGYAPSPVEAAIPICKDQDS